jgi:hypothetical protein
MTGKILDLMVVPRKMTRLPVARETAPTPARPARARDNLSW